MAKERQYWLHRITGGANAWPLAHHLLAEEELLSIGWSDFSTDEFIESIRSNNGMSYLESSIKTCWGVDTPPRSRWSLWHFIIDMRPGDWVIVPSEKHLSIYEILDEIVFTNFSLEKDYSKNLEKLNIIREGHYLYQCKEGKKIVVDLGFYRKVKLVAPNNISREKYCDAKLTSRLKIRQTTANVSDLENDILSALKRRREDRPIQLKNSILESAEDAVYQMIHELADPIKFESLVAGYLKSLGAEFVHTPAKNSSPTDDGDADKVAYFDKLKLFVIVQAKKHSGKTNDWAVQQITSYAKNSAPESDENGQVCTLWVISSCDDYDDKAKDLASEYNVRLINGHEFARLILEVGVDKMPL